MIEDITSPHGPRRQATELAVALIRAYAAGVEKAEQDCFDYLDIFQNPGPHTPTDRANQNPAQKNPYERDKAVIEVIAGSGSLTPDEVEDFVAQARHYASETPAALFGPSVGAGVLNILGQLNQAVNMGIATADADRIPALQKFSNYLLSSGLQAMRWNPKTTTNESIVAEIQQDLTVTVFRQLRDALDSKCRIPGMATPKPN